MRLLGYTGHRMCLANEHILKVSVDFGSLKNALEALKNPSTIKWAMARVVGGVKRYKGMLDVLYEEGKPCVWGGCDNGSLCEDAEGHQHWKLFPLSDKTLPPFLCPACTKKVGLVSQLALKQCE